MESPHSNYDIFLATMREALGRPQLTIEEAMQAPLAKRLLRLLQQDSASAPEPEPGVERRPALLEFTTSHVVVQAAIEDTYALDQEAADSRERAALLESSDLIMINGRRRLRLRDPVRADIIAAIRDGSLYSAALADAVKTNAAEPTDSANLIRLPTIWLQRFLSGSLVDLESVPPVELKAALAARERLRLVANLHPEVPPLADLARRVGLAELLEPLRLLIGAEGGWNGAPRTDRFVGRHRELQKLRAFVDELSSQTLGELVTRASARVSNVVSGRVAPGLMIIEARGGLGKSALLAKFVLDHALRQSRPFPFAYLDFDRATLDPERPHQILMEIARQVGLQIADAQSELERLIEDIRIGLGRQSAPPEATTSAAEIKDPFARFAEILRQHATFGERAFLLILDTVEVVQWNVSAMDLLAGLVDEFRRKGLDELRVVASGRADIPELRKARGARVPSERIALAPLSIAEALQMANVLGSRSLGESWNPAWAEAIAKPAQTAQSTWIERILPLAQVKGSDMRRDPLAVRVAVDLIMRSEATHRPALATMISQTGTNSNEDFVARLYEKRIVNHVRDKRAQKLAWPGLVVRRVTVEIAREVLAPFCQLDPEEAGAAFTALGHEIWMVVPEGDALRHRPDLRARTLPLMRRKDPVAFGNVAGAAAEYFARHRERSLEDRAEWLYHRLLLDEEPGQVNLDITPDVFPLLARAENDFPPESPAASYLASRTATRRLSPSRIRQLRPIDALHHLSVTSSGTFAFDDVALDPVALNLADRLEESNDRPTSPWAIALWVKTGAWNRLKPRPRIDSNFTNPLLRAHAFWAARIVPSMDRSERRHILDEYRSVVREPSEHNNGRLGARAMIQLMALARFVDTHAFSEYDVVVAEFLATMKPNAHPSFQAALRTAIVLGEASRLPALDLWLSSRSRGDAERVRNPTFSLAEIRELARVQPEVLELATTESDEPQCLSDERAVSSILHTLGEMRTGVSERAGVESQLGGRSLARMFARRDEDWIAPFGYAAQRATHGRFSSDMVRSVEGYIRRKVTGRSASENEERPKDLLAAIRMADEASDLAGFAGSVLASCEPNAAATQELKSLIYYRNTWSDAIARLADGRDETPLGDPIETVLDGPPSPPSVVDHKDPQNGRWGGMMARNGRAVRAILESVERSIFYFSLVVESTDGSLLRAPVVFHLHDSFPRSIVSVRRIVKERQAILSDWNAYGVFTVGVQVRDAKGTWTSLELNMATLSELPARFRKR